MSDDLWNGLATPATLAPNAHRRRKSKRGNNKGKGGANLSYAEVVEGNGATNVWLLDETAGTTATDNVGSENGTYSGSYTLNQTGGVSDGRTYRGYSLSVYQALSNTPCL